MCGRRDVRSMSRKERTRLAAAISSACGALMIGEKRGRTCRHLLFVSFSWRHVEGWSRLRATADARTSMARGARGVHDAGVRVESLWRRSAECRVAIRGGVALSCSRRPGNSGASISRAATTYARSSSRARASGVASCASACAREAQSSRRFMSGLSRSTRHQRTGVIGRVPLWGSLTNGTLRSVLTVPGAARVPERSTNVVGRVRAGSGEESTAVSGRAGPVRGSF